MNRLIGYIRVSTEEQEREGLSLPAQEQRIMDYAKFCGCEIKDIIKDPGISAGKPLYDRPGGKKLLEMVGTKEVDGVVALKLDRLFRSASDCLAAVEALDTSGKSLHLIDMGNQALNTSGPMGKFFLTIMAGVAELERNQTRERTSIIMQHMKSKGMYTGGQPPYGFKIDEDGKMLVIDEKEQAILERICNDRKTKPVKQIIKELRKAGIVSRSGKPFQETQIIRIVKRCEENEIRNGDEENHYPRCA